MNKKRPFSSYNYSVEKYKIDDMNKLKFLKDSKEFSFHKNSLIKNEKKNIDQIDVKNHLYLNFPQKFNKLSKQSYSTQNNPFKNNIEIFGFLIFYKYELLYYFFFFFRVIFRQI